MIEYKQVKSVTTFMAKGARPLEIHFRLLPDEIGKLTYDELRQLWQKEAGCLMQAMLKSLPGGLIDALFGELCTYKASVFVVPHLTEDNDDGKEQSH